MAKNDMMKFCRYYNGEKTCPYKDTDPRYTAWRVEMLWLNDYDVGAEQTSYCIDDYVRRGLSDYRMSDGVPVALKAFLMNRYFQYAEREDVNDFKKFYELLYS